MNIFCIISQFFHRVQLNWIYLWEQLIYIFGKKKNELKVGLFTENLLLEPMPRCRLCAEEIFEEDLTYLHEESSEDGVTVADKINACLPVVVSKYNS